MAQFRTTADVMDLILTNGGEVTNGNSSYETQVLNYLNRVHFAIVAGGTIPIGKDSTVEIDEVWPWSRCKSPTILELQPKYDTGTITLTQGSETGVFSSAPAASLRGYHFRVAGRDAWLKIASHTAGASAFELDGGYPDSSGSALNYTAVKLDYDLVPDFIVVNSGNDKFQFSKAAGVVLTATLTHGTYAPADLISHIATVATTAASGPTITGAYSTTTRKFALTSNLAGATLFYIVGDGDQTGFSVHKTIGFDDETSSASAATFYSSYVLGGLARLIEPMKVHKGSGSIFGCDSEAFQRNYPLNAITESVPTKFHVLKEASDGTLTVRFNAYPVEKTRIEVEHVPVPRDLKDTSASVPLIPRKHVDVLEDAGTFYLMLNKNDDRAQVYANLAQGKLKAMIAQNRGAQVRSGQHFGQIIPRIEQMGRRRNLFGGEPY